MTSTTSTHVVYVNPNIAPRAYRYELKKQSPDVPEADVLLRLTVILLAGFCGYLLGRKDRTDQQGRYR